MAFYVFPPKGTVPLEKLRHITTVRLKFLIAIRACGGNSAKIRDLVSDLEVAEDSDILIEDSDKDRISHFCLRMTCLQDSQAREFFLEAETMLFAYRVSCMEKEELLNAVKPLRKLLVKAEVAEYKVAPSLVDCCHMILYILHGRGWSRLIDCYFDNLEDEFVNVPFQYVDELVARRCVELRKGIAAVPVSKLCDLLVILFRHLLEYSVYRALKEAENRDKDRRFLGLFMIIKNLLRKSGLHGERRNHLGTFTADQVDFLSASFPPCMGLLHSRLRTTHRLPHHARIRYTLFLKEAGLALHEALQFWREEYSKESVSSGCHDNGCTHSWQFDAKRYTYNIRHLYGLEGSRKNYRGHSCEAIQESSSTTEAVGCPFKHFDSENLKKLLGADVTTDKSHLVEKLRKDGDYARCCHLFREIRLEKLFQTNLPSRKEIKDERADEKNEQGKQQVDITITPVNLANKDIRVTDAKIKREPIDLPSQKDNVLTKTTEVFGQDSQGQFQVDSKMVTVQESKSNLTKLNVHYSINENAVVETVIDEKLKSLKGSISSESVVKRENSNHHHNMNLENDRNEMSEYSDDSLDLFDGNFDETCSISEHLPQEFSEHTTKETNEQVFAYSEELYSGSESGESQSTCSDYNNSCANSDDLFDVCFDESCLNSQDISEHFSESSNFDEICDIFGDISSNSNQISSNLDKISSNSAQISSNSNSEHQFTKSNECPNNHYGNRTSCDITIANTKFETEAVSAKTDVICCRENFESGGRLLTERPAEEDSETGSNQSRKRIKLEYDTSDTGSGTVPSVSKLSTIDNLKVNKTLHHGVLTNTNNMAGHACCVPTGTNQNGDVTKTLSSKDCDMDKPQNIDNMLGLGRCIHKNTNEIEQESKHGNSTDSGDCTIDDDANKTYNAFLRTHFSRSENLQTRIFKPVDYYLGYQKMLDKLKLLN